MSLPAPPIRRSAPPPPIKVLPPAVPIDEVGEFVARQVHRHGQRRIDRGERFDLGAGGERVAVHRIDRVRAAADGLDDEIVRGLDPVDVVVGAAGQDVGAGAADQDVVAGQAVDDVVAAEAVDDVVAGRAVEDVGAFGGAGGLDDRE